MYFHATPVGLGAAAGTGSRGLRRARFSPGVFSEEQVLVQPAVHAFQRNTPFSGFGLTRSQLDAQDFRRTYV
jgi:hypothetical protein